MPADGLLDIDLAYGRQGLRISLPADRTTVVAPAYHPAAPDIPAALREASPEVLERYLSSSQIQALQMLNAEC